MSSLSEDVKAKPKCYWGHERKFLFCAGNSLGLLGKVYSHKTQRGLHRQTDFKIMSCAV